MPNPTPAQRMFCSWWRWPRHQAAYDMEVKLPLYARSGIPEVWLVELAEVLQWVAQGKTNMEIGTILGVSPRTVQKHLEHIHQKLGVETRMAAAMRALALGASPER